MLRSLAKYLFFLCIFLWNGYNNVHAHFCKTDETFFSIQKTNISSQFSFPSASELKKSTSVDEKEFKLFVDEEEDDETESTKKYFETNKYFLDLNFVNHLSYFDDFVANSLVYYKTLCDKSSSKIYLILRVIRI